MERHAFRGKSTIVYLIYEEKTNPKAQYEKQTTQRENALKCFAYSCLVFCLCLSLWRLSDLQIRTGKKNRQKNKNKLRQNVLHSGVLLLFVSVLFSGDSGRGSQICTFPWRKKTVVQINETKKGMRFTALEHEGFSFFSVQIWDPRISGEKMQTESKTRRCKSLLRTLVFVFFASFCGGWEWGWWCVVCFYCFCSVWLLLSKVQDAYTGSNLLFPV